MQDFKNILINALHDLNIMPDPENLADLVRYRSELHIWNEKISLVSLNNPYDLPVRHITDSLTILPTLVKKMQE